MFMYKGCSLFMNGFELSDPVSYTPPEIQITKTWFKTGAMNAAIPVDRGTEPMTATYKCSGVDYASFLLFGVIPGIKARLTVRRAYRGDMNGVEYIEEEIEGFVDSIRPDDHGNDNKSDVGQSVTISASYYKVSLNGVIPLLEINPMLGLRKVMGINVLGIPANILSLIL